MKLVIKLKLTIYSFYLFKDKENLFNTEEPLGSSTYTGLAPKAYLK